MEELDKNKFYESLDNDVKDYEAKKEVHDMANRPSKMDHEHSFIQLGSVAQCNCGWGLVLDTRDSIKEGHLYREGTLIL